MRSNGVSESSREGGSEPTTTKKKKQIIRILLAICMLLSLLSIFHTSMEVVAYDMMNMVTSDLLDRVDTVGDLTLHNLNADTLREKASNLTDAELETYHSKIQELQLALEGAQESRRTGQQQALVVVPNNNNLPDNNDNFGFETKTTTIQKSQQLLENSMSSLESTKHLPYNQDVIIKKKPKRFFHIGAKKNREEKQQKQTHTNGNYKLAVAKYNQDKRQSQFSYRQAIARGKKIKSPPILLVHYHKTGSFFLIDFMNSMDRFHAQHGISSKKPQHREQHKHYPDSGCPQLDNYYPGALWRINAPDFFCDLTTAGGESTTSKSLRRRRIPPDAKIIHFIRDPIDMALSNYLYHAQHPTPERWVYKLRNPCKSHDKLLQFVVPFLNISLNETYAVTQMCNEYFDLVAKQVPNTNFYEALTSLPPYEGLRLASAQFLLAPNHESGGDILRMANNIKRLEEWSQGGKPGRNNHRIMTVTMNQVHNNTAQTVINIVNFILSDNIPDQASRLAISGRIAMAMERDLTRHTNNPNNNHVTQEILTATGRQRMKEKLEKDEILGPLLLKLRSIVNGDI